jgi:hypothetical protein
MVMVFNATFNNISVISWWSVLLVEETRVPQENHRPVPTEIIFGEAEGTALVTFENPPGIYA